MSSNLKKILLSEASKKADNKNNGSTKMLKKLHSLDDSIEDFIDDLEDKINSTKDNPVFIKRAHQLLANMSKEYSEFIMALRAIVNAVDRKGQTLPKIDRFESKVRDVNSNDGSDDFEGDVEDEEKSSVREALER